MRAALQLLVGGVNARNLSGAIGCHAFLWVFSPREHGVGELCVAFSVDHLVLRPRNSGQHVGDDLGWIVEITVVHETQTRELLLEEFDGFGAIHHPRIFGQAEFCMEAADNVEPEGVERSYPHGGCSLWLLPGDPFGHLARRLVGEGKQ